MSTFIAEGGRSYGRARELCERCPVRRDCLAYALDDPELVGYWGGTTARQRDAMRRAAG